MRIEPRITAPLRSCNGLLVLLLGGSIFFGCEDRTKDTPDTSSPARTALEETLADGSATEEANTGGSPLSGELNTPITDDAAKAALQGEALAGGTGTGNPLAGGSGTGNPIVVAPQDPALASEYISANQSLELAALLQREDIGCAVVLTDKLPEGSTVDHLIVRITELRLLGSGEGEVFLPLEDQSIDLTTLREGRTTILSTLLLPQKSFRGLDFRLAPDYSLQIDGNTVEVDVPGERIKVLGDFDLSSDRDLLFVLDFSPEESLMPRGSGGGYLLHPVVRLKTIAEWREGAFYILQHHTNNQDITATETGETSADQSMVDNSGDHAGEFPPETGGGDGSGDRMLQDPVEDPKGDGKILKPGADAERTLR